MGISSTGYQRPRGGIAGSGQTSATSYQTILSVAGAGRLVQILACCTDTVSAYTGNIRITIDNIAIAIGSFAANANNPVYIFMGDQNNIAYATSPQFLDLNFKKNLLIEAYSYTNGISQNIYYVYELE